MDQGVYEYKLGTSVAAPHVAGVAALLWSCKPDATAAQIRDAMQ
jgi:serine protease